MITINIMGGLGNQLFQIFATLAYGIRYGHKIVFPYSQRVSNRPTYWDSMLSSIKIMTTFYGHNGTNNDLLRIGILNLEQHHHIPIPYMEPTSKARLHGYFQSHKYFEDCYEQICKLLKLRHLMERIRYKYSKLFVKGDVLYNISMHFRIGDYKKLQEYHNVLGVEYYRNALNYMIGQYCNGEEDRNKENIQVWYFCEEDNLAEVEEMIGVLKTDHPDIEFVHISDNIVDWEQMLLMSNCRANIIANSTFSWWGAYLNQSADKIVCYPSQWFGPKYANFNMQDMFPETWKVISIL